MRPATSAPPTQTVYVAATVSAGRVVQGIVGALLTSAALTGNALAWSPEPTRYGVVEQKNVPVTMSDGTVLRVNVYYPATGGRPARGRFPVLLTQTPYGKDAGVSSVTGEDSYLIERGYVDVVADVRGTGDSGGQFGFFDPAQQQDGATLVHWAAKLPHSDGKVGLYGGSYLGINQLLTVARLGQHSPVKAIFPIIAGNDIYRDTTVDGGLIDIEFGSLYVGLTGTLNVVNPVAENPSDPLDTFQVELQHTSNLANFDLPLVLNAAFAGSNAYDGPYWLQRSPVSALQAVARDGVPAYLVGGWYDIFQRGEPLNFSGLQNALVGRSIYGPMSPSSPSSPRYQLLMGPWYHLTAAGQNFDALMLQWFDRWLKSEQTGIDQTRTPAHLYLLGANRYVQQSQWPPASLQPTTWYLGAGRTGSAPLSQNDGTLAQSAPTSPIGADQIDWLPADANCSRELDQWSMGAFEDVTGPSNPSGNPCANNDALTEAGPGSLTYTTAPFTQNTVIGGPVDATIYASSTRPDTEFVATLEDVAPDGTATPITTGALLGSLRATDASNSWIAPNGRPLLPYHPYTLASKQLVPVGTVTRFDIEIRPTFAQLDAGHRLRLTLTTSDLPTLVPTTPDSTNLIGGIYEVQRNQSAASFLELLSAPAAQLTSGVRPATHRVRHHRRRHRRARHRHRRRAAPKFTG
jgi:putative CocE/NonD family hydrolase